MLLLFFSIGSCSKKENLQKTALYATTELFNILPETTLAYWYIDTQSEPYKAYRQQFGNDVFALSDLIPAEDSELGHFLGSFLRGLTASGLISDDITARQSLRQALTFSSSDESNKQIVLGAALVGMDGINLREKLNALAARFNAEGLPTKEETLNGNAGFKITLAQHFSPIISNEFYFSASSDRLFITTTKELAQSLLAKNFSSGFQRIQKLPAFTAIDETLPKVGQVALAFVDFTQLFSVLAKNLPSPQLEKVRSVFPAEAMGYSLSLVDTPRSSFIFSTVAKSDDQKRWLGNITADRLGEAFKFALPKSDLALYLDGGFLANAKKAALSEITSDAQDTLKKSLQFMEGSSSVTISALQYPNGSPVPSFAVTFKPSSAQPSFDQVKNALADLIKDFTGTPLSWKERAFRGTKALSAQSALAGFGLTLGILKDRVILSTSEEAFQAQAEISASSQGLLSTLPNSLSKHLLSKKPLLAVYLKGGVSLAKYLPFVNLPEFRDPHAAERARIITLNVAPGLLSFELFSLP